MFAIVSGVIHKGYKHFASLNIAKAKKNHILSHPGRHTLMSTLFTKKYLCLISLFITNLVKIAVATQMVKKHKAHPSQ